ncbi:hypothetical protein ACFYQ5_14215 [Streptomyces sp. NPDC005794]|uniref:hypothetical protein n=1 Tax=Streptomyces sp. NPDC005794 TaxID=3364733 RepID=UPI00369576A8
MSRPGRVRALWSVVAAAVLLTGCTGAGSEAAPPDATQATQPTRTPTPTSTSTPTPTVSPTPSTAAEIAEAVDHWYEYGGGTAMTSLIGETVRAEARRPTEDLSIVTVDFEDLLEAVRTARVFGSIPDPKTQKAWSAALDHLERGAGDVLGSVPENSMIQSPQEAGQAAYGWNMFDKGVKSLKTAEARLDDAFGLKPESDPWLGRQGEALRR